MKLQGMIFEMVPISLCELIGLNATSNIEYKIPSQIDSNGHGFQRIPQSQSYLDFAQFFMPCWFRVPFLDLEFTSVSRYALCWSCFYAGWASVCALNNCDHFKIAISRCGRYQLMLHAYLEWKVKPRGRKELLSHRSSIISYLCGLYQKGLTVC